MNINVDYVIIGVILAMVVISLIWQVFLPKYKRINRLADYVYRHSILGTKNIEIHFDKRYISLRRELPKLNQPSHRLNTINGNPDIVLYLATILLYMNYPVFSKFMKRKYREVLTIDTLFRIIKTTKFTSDSRLYALAISNIFYATEYSILKEFEKEVRVLDYPSDSIIVVFESRKGYINEIILYFLADIQVITPPPLPEKSKYQIDGEGIDGYFNPSNGRPTDFEVALNRQSSAKGRVTLAQGKNRTTSQSDADIYYINNQMNIINAMDDDTDSRSLTVSPSNSYSGSGGSFSGSGGSGSWGDSHDSGGGSCGGGYDSGGSSGSSDSCSSSSSD